MNKPAPVQTTDEDFYVRVYTIDWDYIDVDMEHVDLEEAARLIRLANKHNVGIIRTIPVLIYHDPNCDLGHRWRVVKEHTSAYAACKLAKLWGSRDSDVEGNAPEHSGMVRCIVLNDCRKGARLGKEQPSQQYIDAVMSML